MLKRANLSSAPSTQAIDQEVDSQFQLWVEQLVLPEP